MHPLKFPVLTFGRACLLTGLACLMLSANMARSGVIYDDPEYPGMAINSGRARAAEYLPTLNFGASNGRPVTASFQWENSSAEETLVLSFTCPDFLNSQLTSAHSITADFLQTFSSNHSEISLDQVGSILSWQFYGGSDFYLANSDWSEMTSAGTDLLVYR